MVNHDFEPKLFSCAFSFLRSTHGRSEKKRRVLYEAICLLSPILIDIVMLDCVALTTIQSLMYRFFAQPKSLFFLV